MKKRRMQRMAALMLTASLAMSPFSVSASEEEDHSSWVSETPLEITIMEMDSANQPKADDTPAHDEIFNKTNVRIHLQIVPSDGYDEKKNIALATDNFPDIIYLRSYDDLSNYGTEGIFEPLTQYINEETMPNFYKLYQEHPNIKKYFVDGELYAFPGIAREETAAGFGPCIRMDLLEENNLEVPTTFDELLDVLEALKEIYPDSIPWTCRKGTAQLLQTTSYMLGCGHGGITRGNGLYWDEDLGKYVYGPADERFKTVLSYLNEAYERGILDPEYAMSDSDTMTNNMQSGKSFFFIDNSGFASNYTSNLRNIDGMEDAYIQLISVPENSYGESRAIAYDTEFTKLYAINANAENKEEIIKFIDWMYSQEGSDITNYGVEGLYFEYNEDGEAEYIEDYIMQYKDATPTDYYAVWAELGITKLDFCLWAMNTKNAEEIQRITGAWTEETDEYWEILSSDDAYVAPHMAPPLTSEEAERVQDLATELDTFFTQQYDSFIMGTQPIENWDALIEQAEEMGVRELEQIYNDAEARVNAE